jgi:hypothetical protein
LDFAIAAADALGEGIAADAVGDGNPASGAAPDEVHSFSQPNNGNVLSSSNPAFREVTAKKRLLVAGSTWGSLGSGMAPRLSVL